MEAIRADICHPDLDVAVIFRDRICKPLVVCWQDFETGQILARWITTHKSVAVPALAGAFAIVVRKHGHPDEVHCDQLPGLAGKLEQITTAKIIITTCGAARKLHAACERALQALAQAVERQIGGKMVPLADFEATLNAAILMVNERIANK